MASDVLSTAASSSKAKSAPYTLDSFFMPQFVDDGSSCPIDFTVAQGREILEAVKDTGRAWVNRNGVVKVTFIAISNDKSLASAGSKESHEPIFANRRASAKLF